MNVFINTKTTKRILIVLVILILFNFACPKVTRANALQDIGTAIVQIIARLAFYLVDGIQSIINGFFLSDAHQREVASTEAVVMGKFLLMEPNIFLDASQYQDQYWDYDKVQSGKSALRLTIAAWYYALRNLAIVALLSILVYVAIRMVLTSTSQDKVKYKTMFKDWLVALCLLFIIHYMMVGILNMSTKITQTIGTSGLSVSSDLKDQIEGQLNGNPSMDACFDALKYTILYLAVVIMNIIFIVKYIIRSITIIFLILLAPVSCITYPIDKISDGKAQAYDTWFKEFLYQVIIQPFHLLLYVVLIGSSVELAKENILYSMVCFGAMIPAEKFVKQMFGFKDKLGSPLGAFATGAVANQLMNSFRSGGKSASSGGGKEKDGGSNDELPPRTKDMDLPGAEGGEAGGNTPRTANDSTADADGRFIDPVEPATATAVEAGATGAAVNEAYNTLSTKDEQSPEGNSGLDTAVSDKEKEDLEEVVAEKEKEEDKEKGLLGRAKDKYDKAKDRVMSTKGGAAIAARHNSKLMRKYGTTDPRKLAARRLQRLGGKMYSSAKGGAKRTIKGITTTGVSLLGTAALGAFGALFGKGKEGMALGASLGGKLGSGIGNGVINAAGKIAGTAKEYASDVYNSYGNHSDEKAKREFKENEGNIKLARSNYKDREGKEANGKALDQELENMYKLSSYGVNKDQYKSALSNFNDYKGALGEDDAWKTAVNQAKLAQAYSAKDFRDPKTMQQLSDNLREQYKALGKGDIAQDNINRLITGAAAMKGVNNVALPAANETIDVPIEQRLPELLGMSNNDSTTVQAMSNLTVRLRENGYNNAEIERLANMYKLNGGNPVEFENTVNAAIEYMEDGNARHEAEKVVRALNDGIAHKDQVNQEMKERFVIKNTFNVSEKDVSAMRETEIEKFDVKKEQTQIQAAREFAIANRELIKGKRQGQLEEKTRELTNMLGGSEKNKIDAKNIANLAGIYIQEGKV